MPPVPETTQPKNHRAIRLLVVFTVLFIIAAMICGAYLRYHSPGTPATNIVAGANIVDDAEFSGDIPVIPQTNVVNPNMPSSLTVLYSTEATSTHYDHAPWLSNGVNIWEKEGNSPPQLLISLPNFSNYWNAELSSKNSYLSLFAREGVYLVNLHTKRINKIYTPSEPGSVSGGTFSQDESKLLISDSNVLHSIDIATGHDVVIGKRGTAADDNGVSYEDIQPYRWRTDGKILFYPLIGKDCGTYLGYLTIEDGIIHAESTGNWASGVSTDGMVMLGEDIESIPSTEEGMCEMDYSSVVSVIEPTGGTTLGRVGVSGAIFNFIAFSPDHKSILYKTTKDQSKNYTYYLQDISPSSTPKPLSDPQALLASWKAAAGPVTGSNYETDKSLLVQKQPILTSDVYPNLIAQFYR